jgi:hypothetical protein
MPNGCKAMYLQIVCADWPVKPKQQHHQWPSRLSWQHQYKDYQYKDCWFTNFQSIAQQCYFNYTWMLHDSWSQRFLPWNAIERLIWVPSNSYPCNSQFHYGSLWSP